jgi:DNA polymerase III subunit delta'
MTPWHGIYGHNAIVEQFRRALERKRLAGSFLFVGPPGIGKRSFALKFAQALLCETRPEELLDPCEHCPACAQAAAGTHPDLDVVGKPEGKSEIPVELLIGDLEHRRREGLCARIALKPYAGRRKIAVIDDADFLNAEGANALLKTLEEPPPRSVLILISSSPARQLPTIRSRCQLIRFQPLPPEIITRLLLDQAVVNSPDEAARLASLSEGRIGQAIELADPEIGDFRHLLYAQLQQGALDTRAVTQKVTQFVENAGKEAPARRQRLHLTVRMAANFYQERLLAAVTSNRLAAAGTATNSPGSPLEYPHDPARLAERLDCCLDTDQQIDRNANQTTLIESWVDALAAF